MARGSHEPEERSMNLTLGDLVKRLEQEMKRDPGRTLVLGFARPHSYRGDYSELAFEPATNVAVRQMLADARSALEEIFEGYKGGEYRMGEYTAVWLARYGETGEQLGRTLVEFLLTARPEEAWHVAESVWPSDGAAR